MFHSNTELLIDYWRGLPFRGAAPSRADVDPAHFARLAPQAVIVGRNDAGQHLFRLAGAFVGELHGADLRGRLLARLWSEPSHLYLKRALDAARRDGEPVIAIAQARAGAAILALEMPFLPLIGPSGVIDRFLGLYQPTGPVARLMGEPVTELILKSVATATGETPAAPRLRLAAVDGRQVG